MPKNSKELEQKAIIFTNHQNKQALFLNFISRKFTFYLKIEH